MVDRPDRPAQLLHLSTQRAEGRLQLSALSGELRIELTTTLLKLQRGGRELLLAADELAPGPPRAAHERARAAQPPTLRQPISARSIEGRIRRETGVVVGRTGHSSGVCGGESVWPATGSVAAGGVAGGVVLAGVFLAGVFLAGVFFAGG